MITNATEILSRGMKILSHEMWIVDAEKFLFLVKTERFDYTQWQREYFGGKTKEEMDSEMDAYFTWRPYNCNDAKIIRIRKIEGYHHRLTLWYPKHS